MQVVVVEKIGRKFVQTRTVDTKKKIKKSEPSFCGDGSAQRCKMGQIKGKFRWR